MSSFSRRLPRWSRSGLSPGARAVSASRRTDVPALYAPWFRRRIREGFADYVPAGPPRVLRASLRPEDVTHLLFWTKWPRPFMRALAELREAGFPVLWQVTITGLGGTPLEPGVPEPARVAAATRDLLALVPARAIAWRYDPVLLTRRHDRGWHRERFRRLADELAGKVDRVVVSPVARYGRRVLPDLRSWEREGGDRLEDGAVALAELVGELAELAAERGLPAAVCSAPALAEATGLPPAGCGSWGWARRAWPELAELRPLPVRPGRAGCTCCREVDIGVYDTCTMGCRYSYGSSSRARAAARARRHDPEGSCILGPGGQCRPLPASSTRASHQRPAAGGQLGDAESARSTSDRTR